MGVVGGSVSGAQRSDATPYDAIPFFTSIKATTHFDLYNVSARYARDTPAMDDLDDDGCLVTDSGKKVPKLHVGPSMFIDRTIVIYGPSKTGKTVITKHIMKEVNGNIEQILVVAPSESSNRSYEGFVDSPFIHYRLYLANPANPKKDDGTKGALRFLEAIWKRQEMMAAIYTRANSAEILSRLYGRLPHSVRSEGARHIEVINSKREHVIAKVRRQYSTEVGRCEEKVKDINEKFKKMLILLYKKFIAPSYEELWREDLNEDERYSLTYLNFNPRLLLIFDDCAAQLKPFFSKEIFRLLFYQNRHSFITVILCCQDDTDLPANLRKNAFISFFTEPIVCTSNFERESNKFPKNTKQTVAELAPILFRGHRKMAYIREDERRQHFYHVQFPYPQPFRFGSEASHELCDEVRTVGVSMDRDNPYFDAFKI
jgi:tRNA A37 threonylcarbamoyladenosine biosynthesis protein TsaE